MLQRNFIVFAFLFCGTDQSDRGCEMVGWHHQLNELEFELTPGAGDRQGGPACCMQSMGSQRVRHS